MRTQAPKINILTMFQRDPNCYYPNVRIDFSDIKDYTASLAKGEDVFKKIIPSYNNDRLHYTSAFVLEAQETKKSCLSQNGSDVNIKESAKEKFQHRIQKITSNVAIQQIEEPEPDSSFCQICRTSFENYQEHVKHRDHSRNLEFSKANKYIKQICKVAKKRCKQEGQEAKQLKKTFSKNKKLMRQRNKKAKNNKKSHVTNRQHKALMEVQKTAKIKCGEQDQTDGMKSRKNDIF